jgi:HD-GYP domain-containing protein (c-di-GMP phosphodiesterase class II)
VGVPTDLLLRSGGLEASERKLVEQHSDIGSRLLKPLAIPSAISAAIRHHHEWWDGTGYPDGLSGKQIPQVARIIGIVDAFDAMSNDRPFRSALDRSVVIDELRRFSGIQFDPEITNEFLLILESGACDIDPEILADAIADARDTTQSANSAAV